MPDCPPILHIQDFSLQLSGASIFSKMDLESVLCSLDFVFVYLDNILIASSSSEGQQLYLRQVLCLDTQGLNSNPVKCQFDLPVINFLLGRCISGQGTVLLPANVRTVAVFPRPVVIKMLQEFLGVMNFYDMFIPCLGNFLQLLHEVLCSGMITVFWIPNLLFLMGLSLR